MSIGIFLAVLFSAAMHASWNALIKFGGDKLQGMFLLSLGHGIMGLAMVAYYPVPLPESWGWLAASVLFHLLYKSMLTLAYQRGDLSRVYPIARGTAPLFVLIASLLFLSDVIDGSDILGVIAVSFGILALAQGVFKNNENRSLIGFALLSALGTAGYAIADGMGARASGHVAGYVGWLFILDALIFMVVSFGLRGKNIFPSETRDWAMGLLAGALSVAAYWIVVWAMTQAPIATVGALREVSVLFAVIIGILFLGEKPDKTKGFAAFLILAGLGLMRL